MKKRCLSICTVLAALLCLVTGCNKPAPEPEPEPQEQTDPESPEQPGQPAEPEALRQSVLVNQDWVYEKRPEIIVNIENPNDIAVTAEVKLRVSTDKSKALVTITDHYEIPGKQSCEISISTESDLEPGYYKAICSVNDKVAGNFVFGIAPTSIVSAPDYQDDFNSFWEAAKAQLAGIDMNATLTEIPGRSSSGQKVYLVEMNSVPDGPDGEPVVVRGYYLEPQDGQKHPVLIHYYGYDDLKPAGKIACPSGSTNPQFSEFYLSTRGQIINNRRWDQRSDGIERDFENIYGDWFAAGFGNKDSYYYRGAFMDCVQAVRFMATRPTSDMENLFAEGSSQGGAFSYAAAALSEYPFKAIAPCVAFMGDFPDYFSIVSWPANVAKSHKGSMSDEQMYAFLSYFDTKNLATRISCSVIACSCLQDGTCPPHTHIAPYNNLISTDKQIYFYPKLQHAIPSDWPGKYMAFFRSRISK